MVSSIKEKLTAFLRCENKKVKIIVVLGIVGILLIMISGLTTNNSKSDYSDNNQQLNYETYTQDLESRLENVISNIYGVGECRVMITLENSYESVYATNSQLRNEDDLIDKKDEYVIYDADSGEAPVLIKEYMPKVMGVSVVCTGGDNVEVKEKIIESITALFNLSANRVSVSKIKS